MRRWDDELAEARLTAAQWVRTRQAGGRLYVDVPSATVASLAKRERALTQATIDAASRVLRHEFDLLGSGPYVPVDPDRPARDDRYVPIDWYLDPVSRQRFPRGIPHSEWNLDQMRPPDADIKLPWELARCQHWAVLGEAYRLTGEERYAIEIASQLRDFVEANPVGVGVNWTCTMDVALRAANWALALELVRACPQLTLDFWAFGYEALFTHGAFIERNLENKYEVTSNHFLSNVVGLFYLASVFCDLPCGHDWDRQCRTWLEQEMTVQVLPDGADYESSIPYHRLVTELFLGAARIAEWRGTPLSDAFMRRLCAMVEFLRAVLRPDGLMPQVGDADDGRLHVFSGYASRSPQDPRHVFAPAATLFNRPDWMPLCDEWGAWEAAWWGCDPEPSKPIGARDGVARFSDAGMTVIRRGGDYLLITNGIVGTGGFGNHKHNDLLGFEYHIDGVPVFVDPGSYVYTPDPAARNLFRSTRSHNTLCIDDVEQNELRPEWLFRMFEQARPEVVGVVERAGAVEWRGRHHGYSRLPAPVVHERLFDLSASPRALTIVDHLKGTGRHRLHWHFHLAPGIDAQPAGAGRFKLRADGVDIEFAAPAGLQSAVTKAWYSPSYGVRSPCLAIELVTTTSIHHAEEFAFRITARQ